MSDYPLSYDSLPPSASPPTRGTDLRCCVALFVLLGICFALAGAGCGTNPEPKQDATVAMPVSDVKLRLLVVGDPAMATTIEQLRGEWNAQTGASFQVRQAAQTDAAATDLKDADVVICPAGNIADLAAKQRIAPITKFVVEDAQKNWREIFPLLRTREALWGNQVVAVPFGSPVFVCYYRVDLLEKLAARPPRTWAEYRKLAEMLADRRRLGDAAPLASKPWAGSLEPLAAGWAGTMLLARAACYAVHRANYSTLFSIETMDPLVAGPPFLRALQELVDAAKSRSPGQLKFDPSAVRRAFWQGECGMAISWPTAADKTPACREAKYRIGFCELPGSAEVYNVGSQSWEVRGTEENPHVPLLDFAGRVGVVTAASASPETASQLLLWLSGAQWGRQVSAVSAATTLSRVYDGTSAQAWVESAVSSSAANQYAETVRQALSRSQSLFAMRISGRAEYLAALDEAVLSAVKGSATPQQALDRAAQRWQETTKRLGIESQRSSYRRGMGLD
ncbi:MAG: ABC transporter substrate-binding protein [Thermoguttaceae bacterium]